MRLTDEERAILDGVQGAAKARAMDLLVRYGEALGAERLVETRNVAGAFNASTCPAISRRLPKGVRVFATDSAKQAHYLPAIAKVQGWYGSVRQCVESAVAGQWLGEVQ